MTTKLERMSIEELNTEANNRLTRYMAAQERYMSAYRLLEQRLINGFLETIGPTADPEKTLDDLDWGKKEDWGRWDAAWDWAKSQGVSAVWLFQIFKGAEEDAVKELRADIQKHTAWPPSVRVDRENRDRIALRMRYLRSAAMKAEKLMDAERERLEREAQQ